MPTPRWKRNPVLMPDATAPGRSVTRWTLATTDGRVVLDQREPDPGQAVALLVATHEPFPGLKGHPTLTTGPQRWPTLEELTAWLADTQPPDAMLALPTLRADRIPDAEPQPEALPSSQKVLLVLLIPPGGGLAVLPHLHTGRHHA